MAQNRASAEIISWPGGDGGNARNSATGGEAPSSPLKTGRGGGNSGDMETRLTRLEVIVENIDKNVDRLVPDLANVRERMATIEERVAHLPSKGFIVVALGLGLTALSGLIVFADQIKDIFGMTSP